MRRLFVLAALLVTLAGLNSAAAASAAPPPSFFGVIPINQLEPQEFAKAQQANIGIVRAPVIWQFVEPNPDDYDLGQLDYYVGEAALQGMDILPFVYSSPQWAVQGCSGAAQCAGVPPLDTPEAREAWQDLLRDLVTRYGPGGTYFAEHPEIPDHPIRQWQCWNEPSSPDYFENPDAARYAELVKLCHDAITSVDPGAKIILAGLFGSPKSSGGGAKKNAIWKYLGRLYKVPGISAFFDGVAIHPYSPTKRDLKQVLNKTLKTITRAGDAGVPMLVTEIGAGSAKPKKGQDRPLIKGEGGQAKLLKQQYNFLINNQGKYNLQNITWYSWKDPDHNVGNCKFCNTAGLFTQDGTPKPSWSALVGITGGTP